MSIATIAETEFDQTGAENFAGRIAETLDAGATSLMLSLGHRTGLFDTMASLPPQTSGQIAEAAGLAERYVREWLAALVTAGVIRYAPGTRTYWLPAEHAACLTQGAVLGNLAVYAQFIAMGGSVEDRILGCFRTGEGLEYGDYPCFHQIMAEDSGQNVVAHLVDTVLPLAEGLLQRLEDGIDVMDAGCGAGKALVQMARAYPNSRFIGYDLCADAIRSADAAAAEAGLCNVCFFKRDLSDFDDEGEFDLITSFDAVHDQKDPQRLLASYQRALRPGGVHLMQEIGGSAHLEKNADFPLATFLYTASIMHCMPVSLGQNGKGLGTMWGWETAQGMLCDAGFASVEKHMLEHDPTNVWFVSRKAK